MPRLPRLNVLKTRVGFFKTTDDDCKDRPIPAALSSSKQCPTTPSPTTFDYTKALWTFGVSVQITLLVLAVVYCPLATLGLIAVAAIGYAIYKRATAPSNMVDENDDGAMYNNVRETPFLYA